MRSLICLTASAALFAATPVFAECTAEQATAKAEQLARKVSAITQSDPQKAKEINDELKAMKLRNTTEGMPDECATYDRRLKEFDEAERKAE
jgi:hypothetical protein